MRAPAPYRSDVAFPLKPTECEKALLRTLAEREHRSMHQDEQRDAFIRDELPSWAPVMERLAES